MKILFLPTQPSWKWPLFCSWHLRSFFTLARSLWSGQSGVSVIVRAVYDSVMQHAARSGKLRLETLHLTKWVARGAKICSGCKNAGAWKMNTLCFPFPGQRAPLPLSALLTIHFMIAQFVVQLNFSSPIFFQTFCLLLKFSLNFGSICCFLVGDRNPIGSAAAVLQRHSGRRHVCSWGLCRPLLLN